jgi:prohibitin 2
VSKKIRDDLAKRAAKFNLVLDDVSITHLAFSPEFTHAVEAKQVAQQTALKAAYLVDQAVQEREVCVLALSSLLSLLTRTSLFAVHHYQG